MYRHRKDSNHNEIKKYLLRIGCSVIDLSDVGGGCPDLLIGRRKVNYLFEVKDGDKSKSRRKLTPAQVKLHAEYQGKIHIIETVKDVNRLFKIKGET